MTLTCTTGNARNGIKGSRVTVRDSQGRLVDRFEVPARNGRRYCEQHPTGQYGQRYQQAIAQALQE